MANAKEMLRINRRNPRGYIRAAQVDRLQERPNDAARWYRHGLKHVARSDEGYAGLEAGLAKCERLLDKQRAFSLRRDPFIWLPIEIAEMILEHFDYRDIVGVLRVSKGWQTFLQKTSLLTSTVDFSRVDAPQKINISHFKAALRRLNQYPRVVRLKALTLNAHQDMLDRLPHWFRKNRLEEFYCNDRCISWSDIASLPAHAVLKMCRVAPSGEYSIQSLLDVCAHLQRLEIIDPVVDGLGRKPTTRRDPRVLKHQRLEILRFNQSGTVNTPIEGLAMPELRHLSLRSAVLEQGLSLDLLTNLRVLLLDGCTIRGPLQIPQALEHLYLGKHTSPGGVFSTYELPHLVSLTAQLTSFGMRLASFLRRCHNLELIDVCCDYSNDETVGQLARLPRLRRLAITENPHVSGIFVKSLLEHYGSQIERLAFQTCKQMSGDTAGWARREHGVDVSISNSEGLAASKWPVLKFWSDASG